MLAVLDLMTGPPAHGLQSASPGREPPHRSADAPGGSWTQDQEVTLLISCSIETYRRSAWVHRMLRELQPAAFTSRSSRRWRMPNGLRFTLGVLDEFEAEPSRHIGHGPLGVLHATVCNDGEAVIEYARRGIFWALNLFPTTVLLVDLNGEFAFHGCSSPGCPAHWTAVPSSGADPPAAAGLLGVAAGFRRRVLGPGLVGDYVSSGGTLGGVVGIDSPKYSLDCRSRLSTNRALRSTFARSPASIELVNEFANSKSVGSSSGIRVLQRHLTRAADV